jgi:CarD family transcriptional regulator
MFSLDEKVVYPGHGVAVIKRIVEKKVAGQTIKLYELKFMNADMTVLVPTNNLAAVGIRKLSSNEGINTIFEMLSEPAPQVSGDLMASNWNKRNKDYQCKLRSGNLKEICKIYRDLHYIAENKELSFGEKGLLQQTEALLAEEISIVTKVGSEKAIEHLRSFFKQAGQSAEALIAQENSSMGKEL